MSQKLYHYSKELYPVLMSRRASGIPLNEDICKVIAKAQLNGSKTFNYVDHISFFMDPIPSKVVGDIFGKTHQFWFPSNEIYEHVILVDELKACIKELSGHLDYDYLKARQRDDWEDGRQKYATNVPHVMLYPKSGEIKVDEVYTLAIGNNHRTKVDIHGKR